MEGNLRRKSVSDVCVVCTRVCRHTGLCTSMQRLEQDITCLPLSLETGSPTESGAHYLVWAGWPAKSQDLPPCAGITGVHTTKPSFLMWVPGIQTQVLVHEEQAFLPTELSPSHTFLFWYKVLLSCARLVLNLPFQRIQGPLLASTVTRHASDTQTYTQTKPSHT